MSLQTHLSLLCPHCVTVNTVTTSALPLGTLLGCSHCRSDLGHWGGDLVGFQNSLAALADNVPSSEAVVADIID